MLAKKYKLTRKDINFIFKKQKIIPGKYFSFFVWLQRPNRKYNQFGFQISIKVSKSSVKRNFIKRIVYNYIRNRGLSSRKFGDKFYKIFIITNKKTVGKLKDLIDSKTSKVEKRKKILKFLTESFKSLNKLEDENFVKNLFGLQEIEKEKANVRKQSK